MLRRALPEVVAGEDSLQRPVRWVHVVDVPDPADLLRGGELVLSTGRGPGDDVGDQRRFIRSLGDQGASALLIELGYSYKRELPEALIAEARAVGLPLIATHRPRRFVEITEAIHGALLDHRLSMLRHAQETGDRLTAIVLERRGLAGLLAELARALQNPVTLENVAGQLVSYAPFNCTERELLEAREEHHRVRDPGALSGRGWLAAEVRLHGRPWGQLTAHELDAPLADGDRVVLERGAVAVALELLYEQHTEQLRARARSTFLVDLMQSRMKESDAIQRATALDFPRRHGNLLAAALGWRSRRWSALGDSPDDAWVPMMPSLQAALGPDRPALLGLHAGRVLLVCATGEVEPDEQQLTAIAVDLRRLLARRGVSEEDATIAFAGVEPNWTGAGEQLGRAASAVLAARATGATLWRDARRSSVVDLLYALRRAPDLLEFTREQLGPLFDERDDRSRELLHTLEVYLQHSASKADAARALHLTRQSLYLRLGRLQRALGIDLDDPDAMLGLHLAVRTLRLTQALAPEERLR
ncbi:MAG: PucR family transcriptional regulator [Solirubrobacteraceae bacterium]